MPLGPSSIDWPSIPSPGQTYQSPDGNIWTWTGYAWDGSGNLIVDPSGIYAGSGILITDTLVTGGFYSLRFGDKAIDNDLSQVTFDLIGNGAYEGNYTINVQHGPSSTEPSGINLNSNAQIRIDSDTQIILNESGGDVSIGTDSPKGTATDIPKLTVFSGDSGVGSTALPIYTPLIVDNDSTSYIGIFSPDANNSGIYLGSPSDPFGTSITWNYDNLKSILASRVANGSWDIIVGNKNDASITIEGKIVSVGDRKADFTLYGDLYLPEPTVPGTAGSAGTTGQMSWDNDYIYVCTGTNSWKRTQINTW